MAANIFTGATDNNWGTATNWSLAAVPTAGDGNVATFNALSPNCTVNASNRVANAIDFTGYTNTITMTFNLTISGAVTLAAAMGIAGTGLLTVNATATLTSNGKTWPNSLTTTAVTITFADTWTIGGTYSNGAGSTLNGSTLNIGGSLTPGGTTLGTTNLVMNGTGTWSGNVQLRNNLTFNTAGTITVSGTVQYNTGTLTYTAGTIVTTGSTLTIATVGTTLNTNGMSWNNVSISGSLTHTLSSNMDVNGTLTLGGSSLTTTINGDTITAGAALTIGATSGVVTGTTAITLDGTGTFSTSGGQLKNNITINTAGTITLSGDIDYNTGTWTYTAGTLSFSSFSLTVLGSVSTTFTLNAAGFTVSTFTITGAGSGTVTVNGSQGCTFTNLEMTNGSGANPILNLKAGNTYIVTTSFIVNHSGSDTANWCRVKSDTGGVQAIFKLNQGATQDVDHCSATDIDSSTGQTIWSYHQDVLTQATTNTLNWQTLPRQPKTISSASAS